MPKAYRLSHLAFSPFMFAIVAFPVYVACTGFKICIVTKAFLTLYDKVLA